jgi:hypothetical protein
LICAICSGVREGGAAEKIELLRLGGDDLGIERLEKQEMLLQAGRDPATPKRFDKADEHGPPLANEAAEVEPPFAKAGLWLTPL